MNMFRDGAFIHNNFSRHKINKTTHKRLAHPIIPRIRTPAGFHAEDRAKTQPSLSPVAIANQPKPVNSRSTVQLLLESPRSSWCFRVRFALAFALFPHPVIRAGVHSHSPERRRVLCVRTSTIASACVCCVRIYLL
ncbi:unnamed protein product [Lasius platythorax]|uniref:Uncharacterized protein n=1 Tax=Lasius platythorax TaxID=488582 RepID=A0AAV2NQN1_9HYME